ncbi:unnamed protein product [Spirodela intermedia]|uniref:GIR1-like zinc ribbon domain-containing protein n=1 Tax=Spirodela intermedia TaxID=51605 RepID=A0A7I8JP00_SPIIN|nr:unnamed protein product [Spirodela intermedia]CAA6671830.1 unnamed protein product [Spirodela intermedia]
MAADVTSLVSLLARYDKENGGGVVTAAGPRRNATLIQKTEIDSPSSCNSLQDLNLPPPPPPPPTTTTVLNVADHPSSALDLKLRALAAVPQAEYQSVCTLEKVKSALARAERESHQKLHRPDPSGGSTSPASSSTTTSSAKRRPTEDCDGDSTCSPPGLEGGAAAEMVAAGCPSCLLYVLISLSKPRCPRCNSAVPLPLPRNNSAAQKKQRIDLNALSSAATATTSAPLRTVKFF